MIDTMARLERLMPDDARILRQVYQRMVPIRRLGDIETVADILYHGWWFLKWSGNPHQHPAGSLNWTADCRLCSAAGSIIFLPSSGIWRCVDCANGGSFEDFTRDVMKNNVDTWAQTCETSKETAMAVAIEYATDT
jgi:hypothetical protein